MPRVDIDRLTAELQQRSIRCLVIGGSFGAVDALKDLLPALGKHTPFAVVVVLHLAADRPNLMPSLLRDHVQLPIHDVEAGEPAHPGSIYIAPPDYHVAVESGGILSLSTEEPVHFSRPSIDVLFDSAAHAYGAQTWGILLTGANADGAEGLQMIHSAGGFTTVQDPDDAKAPEMPRAALERFEPTCLATLAELRALLISATGGTEC